MHVHNHNQHTSCAACLLWDVVHAPDLLGAKGLLFCKRCLAWDNDAATRLENEQQVVNC